MAGTQLTVAVTIVCICVGIISNIHATETSETPSKDISSDSDQTLNLAKREADNYELYDELTKREEEEISEDNEVDEPAVDDGAFEFGNIDDDNYGAFEDTPESLGDNAEIDSDVVDDENEMEKRYYAFQSQLGKRGPSTFMSQLGKRGFVFPQAQKPVNLINTPGRRGPMGFWSQLGKRSGPMGFFSQLGKRGGPMGFYSQLGKRGGPMGFYSQLGKRGGPMGFYSQLGKRGGPMGFYSQLGKRSGPMGFYSQLGKRGGPMGFYSQLGKRGGPMGFYSQLGKRGGPMGFFSQLGKRGGQMGLNSQLQKRNGPMGFFNQLGKRGGPMGFYSQLGKRAGPMGFFSQLGKRFQAGSISTRTPYGFMSQLGKRADPTDYLPDLETRNMPMGLFSQLGKRSETDEDDLISDEDDGDVASQSLSRRRRSSGTVIPWEVFRQRLGLSKYFRPYRNRFGFRGRMGKRYPTYRYFSQLG